MDIDIRNNTSITYIRPNLTANTNNNVNKQTPMEENRDIGKKVNEKPEIWEELAKVYDIRNASFDELCDMSIKLYQSGQISLFDHAMLTFDPSKSPQPIKPNLCLTEANADGKRDWIVEYEARAARNLKMGDMTGYRVNNNVLKILERLIS